LDFKVYPSRIPQLAHFARGLNAMGSQLKDRVDALVRLSNEQDAVLQSMIEGVITIDRSERIMRVNEAGFTLLGISARGVEGRLVEEVVHHIDLQRFIHAAVSSDQPMTETISVRLVGERFLEVYSTPLILLGGVVFGTLIVFHDVSKVKRLENVRRDFVANVSHELKTPITSIKGAVETLIDGALDDPEMAKKFLGMAARHADRLNAIFNDLLVLARLEAEGEEARVEVTSTDVADVLRNAVETCSAQARAKSVDLIVPLSPGVRVSVNPSLFEQAVVNLLDNAIKYTDSGGSVSIEVSQQGALAQVTVTDTGSGIEKAHLPRLFERFYRIDQGRSRKMGGTGLGLAIVKHIAQVHGGKVEVTSTVGRGSSFSLFVPAA
jgi:two-component system phosphate regulon sensor histidine kinase PhoR